MLTRRRFVETSALAGGALAMASSALGKTAGDFPKGFLWGAATAAHQVEGNNVNNDGWLIEGLPEARFADVSGDACDHYHRFAGDIGLLAKLGLNTYRFSIEWARVEPRQGQFSKAELDHYRSVLQACRAAGLKTVVTLHHFTSPLWLARQGAFMNREVVPAFARYAGKVAEHCGDLIDYLCTFNEANMSFTDFVPPQGVAAMLGAAQRATGAPNFSTFLFDDVKVSKPIVREAHVAARQAIKAVRPKLPVGITLAISDVQDAPGATGVAAQVRSGMYGAWLEAARGDDFIGVQNYTRLLFGPEGLVPPARTALLTQLDQEYYPLALANAVRYAAKATNLSVLVTENGIGIEDDAVRVRYIQEALSGLNAVMAEGVDVLGYIHWSAFDNFEWAFGYGPKFGLIAVDRQTQARTPKPSARLLGDIARRNRL
jgi:beta-glucosidase